MMSWLLRYTRFVRNFPDAAKIILHRTKSDRSNFLLNSKSLCACNNLQRDYNTTNKSESLDLLFQKLESDVRRYGQITKQDLDELLNEISSRSDISSAHSLTAIRCCGEFVPEVMPEQRTTLVQTIWKVLTEQGVPMDISHYNALLRVYIENEHTFSPAKFLEELEMKGLQPDRITYQRLMRRYCHDGDIEGATRVLEKMRELNMPISEPVLNALVIGHAFHGDTEGAKAVLNKMVGAGLQPSGRTYTLLACGCARRGDIDEVENIIATSIAKGLILTDEDLLNIMEQFVISGNGDKIDRFFSHQLKGPAFNQAARNTILRLINKGHVDAAKKVLKVMNPFNNEERNAMFKGAFFVKHLLKVKMSPEAVVKTCTELQEDNLVPSAFFIAMQEAHANGETEIAMALISEMRNNGLEIRRHYYWPLLAQKGKENDEEGLLHIMRSMSKEGLTPTEETLKYYVVPYLLKEDTPQNVILKLQLANVYVPHGVRGVMICLLQSGRIKEAAKLAQQYHPKGHYGRIGTDLVNALTKTKDIESFVTVLSAIGKNSQSQHANDTRDDLDKTDDEEIGRILVKAMKLLHDQVSIEKLLSSLYSKGLNIDKESADAIERYLQGKMTAEMSDILSKLISTDSDPMHLRSVSKGNNTHQSLATWECLYENAKKKGLNSVKGLQKQILAAYITENNINKVDTYLEELKKTDFELTMPSLAQLFEFYCVNDNIEKAYEYKMRLIEKEPGFFRNNSKKFLLAHALIRRNGHKEAIKFLIDNKPHGDTSKDFGYKSHSWHLLNTLVEQKDPEKVKEMTEVLIENNYIEPTNILLGLTIEAYLLNEELDGALLAFKECCKQYKCTPCNRELMKSLIMKQEETKLQTVLALGAQIHKEDNLHDLVLSYVECGRPQQARGILATPGLNRLYRRLETSCHKYAQEGKSKYLEDMLEATRELAHIDRSKFFYLLLVSYCKANDTEKALELWTVLQEEGEVPGNDFLKHLADHLVKNKMDVPFSIPEDKTENVSVKTKVLPSKDDMSSTIRKFITQGMQIEATDYVINVMEDGGVPKVSVLKYLMKNLAEQGKVEKLQQLEKHIKSKNLKRSVKYNEMLTLALNRNRLGGQQNDMLLEIEDIRR